MVEAYYLIPIMWWILYFSNHGRKSEGHGHDRWGCQGQGQYHVEYKQKLMVAVTCSTLAAGDNIFLTPATLPEMKALQKLFSRR